VFGKIVDVESHVGSLEFPCVSPQLQELARTLDQRIGSSSAAAHSALADVATAAAEFDDIRGWAAPGIRSFAHWLAISAGFDPHVGSELLRVGQALRALPRIAQAFGAGRLSFDKVRQITTVAAAATEEVFLEIALGASGSQLARICSSLRRIANADAPDHDQRQLAERGLWTEMDEDGMMRLVAKLPPEDAAVVMAALESIAGSRPVSKESGDPVPDPAEEPWAARRADALVSMAEHLLAGGAMKQVGPGAVRQVVVHADINVLTGESANGRCFVEGGAPLSVEAARRIGCDAEIVAVTERDGLPIDIGRTKRFPTDRLRRALEVRDRFCRFPGCGVPANRAHAHHIQHWLDGGPTDLRNLILLCGFDHRRLHDGGYVIREATDGFRFETHDGRLFGSSPPAVDVIRESKSFDAETARAEWGGEAMDLDHTLFVLAQYVQPAGARAGPD
jgi:uncharacterized protein DUF222/HNH endonuclease